MNRAEVEREVVSLFRDAALAGSAREVGLDEPLGEAGFGVDSLALVSFVAAVEKRFSVRLSDELWFDRGQLSLRFFAEQVVAQAAVAREPVGCATPADEGSLARRSFAERAARRLRRALHERHEWVLLERDLTGEPLPTPPSPDGLSVRPASAEELAEVASTWPAFRARSPLARWRDELASGAVCLAAWRDDRIVALDWLSGVGEEESSLGVPIRVRPGTCYGYRLLEHPQAGRGSGLALLADSLHDARRRGFTRQVTFVDQRNARMLSASVQLLGFRPFGTVHSTRSFGVRRTTWRVAGRAGSGGTLVL